MLPQKSLLPRLNHFSSQNREVFRSVHLTTQKSFYVEISRARDRAELVTDDAKALREQLEAVTGERISALEGIGVAAGTERAAERQPDDGPERGAQTDRERQEPVSKDPEIPVQERNRAAGIDLGL